MFTMSCGVKDLAGLASALDHQIAFDVSDKSLMNAVKDAFITAEIAFSLKSWFSSTLEIKCICHCC